MPYLNFHRPCFFPTTEIDAKGKAVKRYRYKDMMTPYEKLKSLANASSFLKTGVSFEQLDKQSTAMTIIKPPHCLPCTVTKSSNKSSNKPKQPA